MHVLEQYALSCGVKIDRPYIYEKYYPIPFDKYITLQASSGMQAKNYSYFSEVINIIKPYLDERNISIVQVGGPEDEPIREVYKILNLSINQTAYLIKNSLMHFGNDSCCLHLASYYGKKSITVSGTAYDQNFYPYWTDKDDYKILSTKTGSKPSFLAEENPKRIDKIKPEKVARAILDFLNIKDKNPSYESLHLGTQFKNPTTEIIPNFFNPSIIKPNAPVNIRLDKHLDLQLAAQWLSGRKGNIFINSQVEVDFFARLKENINCINFVVNPDIELEYIEQLSSTGVNIQLLHAHNDDINKSRLKFIDYELKDFVLPSKKNLDCSEKICDNTRIKSSKIVLSNNSIYPTLAHAEANLNKETSNGEYEVIDDDSVWEDLDFLYIFNK